MNVYETKTQGISTIRMSKSMQEHLGNLTRDAHFHSVAVSLYQQRFIPALVVAHREKKDLGEHFGQSRDIVDSVCADEKGYSVIQ